MYLFGILTMLGGAALALISNLVFQKLNADALLSIALFLGAGFLYLASMLPVFFKLGVENARLLHFIALFIPVFALASILKEVPPSALAQRSDFVARFGLIAGGLLVFLALGISYWLALRIYAAKES